MIKIIKIKTFTNSYTKRKREIPGAILRSETGGGQSQTQGGQEVLE